MKIFIKYLTLSVTLIVGIWSTNAQNAESAVKAVENGLLIYMGGELPKKGYYRVERKGEKDNKFVEIARATSPDNLETLDKKANKAAAYFNHLLPLTQNEKKRVYKYLQTNISDDSLYRAEYLPIIAISAGTAYLDTEVEKDKPYQYKITLFKDGRPVTQKELKSTKNSVVTDLPAPKFHGSDIVNNAVFLEWTVPDMKEMVLFNVYRAYFGTNDFKKIGTKKGYTTSDNGLHLIAIDTTTEKSSMYKYYIQPVDLYGNVTEISEVISAGKLDSEPIIPITSLQSEALDNHQIKLSWVLDKSVVTSNIQILRSNSYDNGFVEIMNLPSDTIEFIDDLPEASENYYYYLKVNGGMGQEFSSAKIAAMIKTNAEELPAPRNVEAKTVKDGIEISWQHDEPYTRGFYVYRAMATNEKFNQVSNLTHSDGADSYSYQDVGEHLRAGEIYRYTIRAENDAYIMGKFSDTIHAFPGKKTTIEVPRKLKSVYRDNVVELYWEDLTEWEPNVLGYKVYRNDVANGTMKLMPNDTLRSYKNHYNDNNVKAGQTYNYQVTTIDLFGVESGKSYPTTVTIPVKSGNSSIPDRPLVFKNSKGVRISWNQIASEDIKDVRIYRSEVNKNAMALKTVPIDKDEFLDTSIKKGGLYYYKISFITTDGKEGNISRETSILF